MKHMKTMFVHGVIQNAIAAGVLSAALLSLTVAAQAADDAGALAQWREAIAHTNVPAAGCFEASYPSVEWNKVECVEAPDIQFIPRTGRGRGPTVGNGNDYAAEVSSGLIRKTVGSFPKVTGVTSEQGIDGANSYSLQLNSNFMQHEGLQWRQRSGEMSGLAAVRLFVGLNSGIHAILVDQLGHYVPQWVEQLRRRRLLHEQRRCGRTQGGNLQAQDPLDIGLGRGRRSGYTDHVRREKGL